MIHKTLFALALVAALLPIPAAAQAAETPELVFPVVGPNEFANTWGNPRSGGRSHRGTDIMADKMVPVVATADGVIDWVHDGTRKRCCALGIEHDDGWESWYIHMNNDTPGTDDGKGWGFADGIEEGARVVAGQLIGWVGDSGNAEGTAPHIHFELHAPSGTAINPYHALTEATEVGTPLMSVADPKIAAAMSAAGFPDGADIVIVTPAELTGAAGMLDTLPAENAPVLLAGDDGLYPSTLRELARLAPATVIVIGDESAVSTATVKRIEAVSLAPTIRLEPVTPDGAPAVAPL